MALGVYDLHVHVLRVHHRGLFAGCRGHRSRRRAAAEPAHTGQKPRDFRRGEMHLLFDFSVGKQGLGAPQRSRESGIRSVAPVRAAIRLLSGRGHARGLLRAVGHFGAFLARGAWPQGGHGRDVQVLGRAVAGPLGPTEPRLGQLQEGLGSGQSVHGGHRAQLRRFRGDFRCCLFCRRNPSSLFFFSLREFQKR